MARVELARFAYRSSCERELVSDSGMGAALTAVGGEAASRSRAVAPVRTGRYVASISATSIRGAGGYEGVVYATAPYAAYIEYGTSDTPEFAPLRRGLAAR